MAQSESNDPRNGTTVLIHSRPLLSPLSSHVIIAFASKTHHYIPEIRESHVETKYDDTRLGHILHDSMCSMEYGMQRSLDMEKRSKNELMNLISTTPKTPAVERAELIPTSHISSCCSRHGSPDHPQDFLQVALLEFACSLTPPPHAPTQQPLALFFHSLKNQN